MNWIDISIPLDLDDTLEWVMVKYGIIDLKVVGMSWKNRKVFAWSKRKACRMILVEKKSGGR